MSQRNRGARVLKAVLSLLSLAGMAASAPAQTFEHGQFRMETEAANAHLPASITWAEGGGIQVLHEKLGLSMGYTSFEFRNKIYRQENKNVWGERAEPRFVVDVPPIIEKPRPVQADGFSGQAVSYENSYAKVERRVLFHDTQPRLRIVYGLTASRDLVVHEPGMFGVAVHFAAGFTGQAILDARPRAQGPLTVEGDKGGRYELTFLNAGPVLVTDPQRRVSVLVRGAISGDLPSPVPPRQLSIKAGQKFSFTIDLQLFAGENDDALKALAAMGEALPQDQRPYVLVEDARFLMQQKKPEDAEKALLLAAELNKQYAAPYSVLAEIRRDFKTPGELSQTEAWMEAAYRQPYNYGYPLSGSGLWQDGRLTEEQRRQAVFNLLISVENTVFYADYYIWAARPFEQMKMYAQACAMYRQALWAVEHMPRPEAYREKFRKEFKEKIQDLEKKLLGQTSAELPELVPVRPGGAIASRPAAPSASQPAGRTRDER